ncbi:STAS domain-containing protein [Leptothrix discophora]|uniref:STAS domain-containing protein n=1 Tax=Leptothrix discophora TaxID=89 RepID=A0ABT9G6N7_LEPDI|nr:STAS domain-containing protein [Leptothrix discophora]MDP4302161.1 STAS domain-containing protein [Leptothrix discophora]
MTATPPATHHALHGELDIQQAQAQREALLAVLAANGGTTQDLLLDLADVTACDSTGVQLLLATRNTLKLAGASLRIVQASPVVREVLRTYGLQGLIDEPAAKA